MGNISGYLGSLPQSWIKKHEELEKSGAEFDQKKILEEIKQWEIEWTNKSNIPSIEPVSDPVQVSKDLMLKYGL